MLRSRNFCAELYAMLYSLGTSKYFKEACTRYRAVQSSGTKYYLNSAKSAPACLIQQVAWTTLLSPVCNASQCLLQNIMKSAAPAFDEDGSAFQVSTGKERPQERWRMQCVETCSKIADVKGQMKWLQRSRRRPFL